MTKAPDPTSYKQKARRDLNTDTCNVRGCSLNERRMSVIALLRSSSTRDPMAHTPTPADRFAIVPVVHGPAPDNAIVVGPMSEVFEYIPQSVARADAVEELEHARFTADQIASWQSKTRAVQATMLADSIAHLSTRLDAIIAQRADQARRDAEREAEEEANRIQAELDALPDPDDPDPDAHHPTGDLHALPAAEDPVPRSRIKPSFPKNPKMIPPAL